MNKKYFIMITILHILVSSALCFGEPFAPKVIPPSGISKESPDYFGVQILNASKVPEKDEVGVAPYPGAKVIQAKDAGPMEVNGQTYDCLKYIKILTPDNLDAVEAFYKDTLKDFRFKSEFGGMIRLFWKGENELSPLDPGMMCTTPNVSLSDTAGMYETLMPGAKTSIEITYR